MKKRLINLVRRIIKNLVFVAFFFSLAICGGLISQKLDKKPQQNETTISQQLSDKNSADNPQVIQVNNNHVTFTEAEMSTKAGSWEKYSNLDNLNRVGEANAMLHKSLMPQEKRGSIAQIRPTGWKNKKILIRGKRDYLYNRSHLIGYQLTGQNANPKNLMTGTRDLNANFDHKESSMVHYENQVASYLKKTNHHVRYQVKPIFRNKELVARGVRMQAKSVEDNVLEFDVYIFNVQRGVKIDYETGEAEKIAS